MEESNAINTDWQEDAAQIRFTLGSIADELHHLTEGLDVPIPTETNLRPPENGSSGIQQALEGTSARPFVMPESLIRAVDHSPPSDPAQEYVRLDRERKAIEAELEQLREQERLRKAHKKRLTERLAEIQGEIARVDSSI